MTVSFGKTSAANRDSVRMPFGKHKGERVEDLPDDYIDWLLSEAEITSAWLLEALEDQQKLRRGEGVVRTQRCY